MKLSNELREANRLNAEGAPKSYGSTREKKTDSIRSQIIPKQPSTKTPSTGLDMYLPQKRNSRLRAFAIGTANLVVGAALVGFIASGAIAVFATGATAATACKCMAIGLAATGSVFLTLGVFLGLWSIVSHCCCGDESDRVHSPLSAT